MNEKTARLIRKYAEGAQANERELKRRWNDMTQSERFAFRREMAESVGAPAEAEAESDAE